MHSKARLPKEPGHSRLRTVSLKYHVSHTGYSSAVCGAVQHSVVWLSNAMRSLVGLCIARHGSAPRRGLAPSGACLESSKPGTTPGFFIGSGTPERIINIRSTPCH